MELLMPGLGLIFWMTIAFGLVLYILKKFAWRPILQILNERQKQLDKSFRDARKIEKEMQHLDKVRTEKMAAAEKEHEAIVARARSQADQIMEEAREKGREEARQITDEAERIVDSYKQQAIQQVKNQLSALSLDMAEKILREEFSDRERNARYVNKLLDEVGTN
ncbi:MAG: F0F1 ATP synthase subunit B [Bacteroidales bacterium]